MLYCWQNQLAKLDVTKCPELTLLYAGSDPSAIMAAPTDTDSQSAPVYDLRGHRVRSASPLGSSKNGSQKGIVIQGGKKIMVR